MPRILAIDTSTAACSAALLIDNEIREIFEVQPQRHTHLILPMIDSLLTEANLKAAQLDAIAFTCGPGSFTGLRIAAGVVKGIAFALSLPVVPISTLLTLAQTAYRLNGWANIMTALDARMSEVYWASFKYEQTNKVLIETPEQLGKPEQIPLAAGDNWYGVGDGWDSYGDVLKTRMDKRLVAVDTKMYPHAYDVATLAMEAYVQGRVVTAEQALPVYLRDNMYRAS